MKKNIFLFLSFLFFSSCSNIQWFSNLDAKINDELKVPVYFYFDYPNDNNSNYVVKYYTVGSVIKQEDFPKNGSKELFQLKPGYNFSGKWQCPDFYATSTSQTTSSGENNPKPKKQLGEYIDFNSTDKTVNKITVPPKELGIIKLYGTEQEFIAREDTPWTLILYLQNIYDSEYNCFIYKETGTTDEEIQLNTNRHYINRGIETLYPNKEGEAYDADIYFSGQEVSLNEGEKVPLNSDSFKFNIKGDGSTIVKLWCNRKQNTIQVKPGYSTAKGTKLQDLGFILNDNCYYIELSAGYELKKLDLQDTLECSGYELIGFSNDKEYFCTDSSHAASKNNYKNLFLNSNIILYPVWLSD